MNHITNSASMRRCIEVIQAGLIGQAPEIHVWHPDHGWPHAMSRPAGSDAVPTELN